MKKIISLLLSIIIVMSFANVSFAAVGDVTVDENGDMIEHTFSDSFDGTDGVYVGGSWTNNTVKGDGVTPAISNLSYKYSVDPKDENNSVFKMEKTTDNTGDKDLRIDFNDFNSGSYVDEDMTVSFRYYHQSGAAQLNLRNYDANGEGTQMTNGSINLYEIPGLPEDDWCDIRIEVDMRSEYKYVINGYITVGGVTTQFLSGTEGTLVKTDGGVSEIDITSRYKSSGTNYVGVEYFDDFNVYINRGTAASDGKSVVFASDYLYKTTTVINTLPVTYEATVKVPTDVEDSGVIIGTYEGKGTSGYFTFDIIGGAPKIYIAANSTAYTFDEVDVRGDEAVHLAIAFDTENKAAYCYVNGELKQTLTDSAYPAGTALYRRAFLGGDASIRDFSRNFKGEITGLTLYSDLRTAEEISTDFAGSTPDADNLIAAYKVVAESDSSNPKVIKDLSGNGHDFYYNEIFIDEVPVEDYAYSFAVVGDTQYIASTYPQSFKGIYDWILDNSEEYNTKFVFGLGDITDQDTNREYALAQVVIDSLKGALPFSIIRGNHDSQAQYNKFFPYYRYEDEVSGSYDGTMLNTYRKFEVGNIKYLHLGLDYNPSAEMLAWADSVVAANPDRNVIVTTHSYLGMSGVRNSHGTSIWDNFVKKHKNIVLVLCGHVIYDSVVMTKSEGDNGNTVTQLLINPQGTDKREQRSGLGMVAMLHFSEDGKDVQLRYYSTVKKKYFLTENQFSFNLDVIESEGEEDIKPEIITSNISFDVDLEGKSTGKLIAALYDGNQRLCESKIYDAAQKVNVSFSKAADNSKVKLMWWDGTTVTPMTNY